MKLATLLYPEVPSPDAKSHLGPEVMEPITSDVKPLKLWANTNSCCHKFFPSVVIETKD